MNKYLISFTLPDREEPIVFRTTKWDESSRGAVKQVLDNWPTAQLIEVWVSTFIPKEFWT